MLCPNYETDPIPYRTTAEMNLLGQWYPAGIHYNDDILPPEQFEVLDRLDGVFMAYESGSLTDSGSVIFSGWTRQQGWPGWSRMTWIFDAETGQFIGRGKVVGGYYSEDVYQGAGGELWVHLITGGMRKLDTDYQPTGRFIAPALYGAIDFFDGALIDEGRDRLIASINVENTLRVFRLSTGELLRSILLPDKPVQVCFEEGSRCYILAEHRNVYLLDYEAGRFLGAVRIDGGHSLWNNAYRMAYDRRFRRLLIVPPPTGTPATLNTTATGYPVRNVATHVLPPIPLKAPRAGRPFPVLIKAIGDRGEGVVGAVSLAGDLVGPNVAGLNGQGEAIVVMNGSSAGVHSLSVSLEVPCLP